MPTLTLILPRPHPSQRRVLREARRFNVLTCGRRWGKSTQAINLAADSALKAQPVGWFAPTYKLLLEAEREAARVLRPVIARHNHSEHRIELVTGGLIEFWTLQDVNAGRSRKYALVIIDEAGLVGNLGEIWQESIRPTLADLRGVAWLLGTPKGRNFFWECYIKGQDSNSPDWISWQRPTADNPYIHPDEIAAMRADMTEQRYAQEVLAAFLEDAGGVFRNVALCATGKPAEQPTAGHMILIGVDWGKSGDFSVFSVYDATARKQLWLDRSNKIDYSLQYGRLNILNQRYKPIAIIPELNSIGIPNAEQLKILGMPVQGFTTTNASKDQIVNAFSLALEKKDIELLDDPIQTAELQAYEMRRLPSGVYQYSAPSGLHDDIVIADCLAYHGGNSPASSLMDYYRQRAQARQAGQGG